MGFWSEWRDDKFSLTFTKVLTGILILVTIFLVVNSELNATLVVYLLGSAITIFFVAQTEKETGGEFLQANFFGDKSKTYMFLVVGLVLGSIIGLASTGGGLSLILPVQAILQGNMNFFFMNVVAPLVEPLFWRGIIFPIALVVFVKLLGKNKFPLALACALLFAAFLFGFYHVNAYFSQAGGFTKTYDIMVIAVIFAILFIITNQLAGTIAMEIGWHFANNLFATGYSFGEILPTIIVFFVGMAIVIEFADRLSRRG